MPAPDDSERFARTKPSNFFPRFALPLLSSFNVTTPLARMRCARASAVRAHVFRTICVFGPPYTATTSGYGGGPDVSASGKYTTPCSFVTPSAARN